MTQPDTRSKGKKVPQWVSRTYEAFFRLLKRLLGQDVRFLARNATLVTISHGVSMVRGLVTGYLVARLFPREMYGQYQFILSVTGAVAVFGLPGMGTAISRAVARGEKGILLPIAKVQFIFSILGSFILLAAIPFLPPERFELWPLFVLAAMLFPLSRTAIDMFSGVTIGKERFDTVLHANLVWSIVVIITTLAILFYSPSAFLLYAAITILPTLAYFWYSRPFLEKSKTAPPIRHILLYGIQITFISLPSALSWYLDKILISIFFGLDQLAIFSIGILIPEQVKAWSKALLPVSFAIQARGKDSLDRRKQILRIAGKGTLLFIAGCIPLILLAPWLAKVLFPNYPTTDLTLLIQLSTVSIIAIPSTLFAQYLEAQGMVRQQRQIQWGTTAIFIGTLLYFIPLLGPLGAVIARIIYRFSGYIISFLYMHFSPLHQEQD